MYLSNYKNVFVQFQKCICACRSPLLATQRNPAHRMMSPGPIGIRPYNLPYNKCSRNMWVHLSTSFTESKTHFSGSDYLPLWCYSSKLTKPSRQKLCQWWTNSIQRPKSVPKQVSYFSNCLFYCHHCIVRSFLFLEYFVLPGLCPDPMIHSNSFCMESYFMYLFICCAQNGSFITNKHGMKVL